MIYKTTYRLPLVEVDLYTTTRELGWSIATGRCSSVEQMVSMVQYAVEASDLDEVRHATPGAVVMTDVTTGTMYLDASRDRTLDAIMAYFNN